MKSPGRYLVMVGLLLLVVRVLACSDTRPIGGGGGATGTGGTGGTTATGGTAGQTNCTLGSAGSFGGGFGRAPCGPAPTCDGNTVVSQTYCDQSTCTGPLTTPSRTDCFGGSVCGGGRCLGRVLAPTMICSSSMDCGTVTIDGGVNGDGGSGLPPSVCIGSFEQLIFTDPTCDGGQCHWREIVNSCNPACAGGECYDPGMLTRGPIPPTATEEATQPPEPAPQVCATAGDCSQPPPDCFKSLSVSSVVSYVNPACRAGACVWEFNLSECSTSCSAGACAGP